MKKTVLKTGVIVALMTLTLSMFSGCGKERSEGPSDSALSGETNTIDSEEDTKAETTEATTEEKIEDVTEVVTAEDVVENDDPVESEADIAPSEEIVNDENKITDQEALTAIENYCYKTNPDLEGIVKEGEYQVGWELETSDEDTIVVLYRSYTGAEVRYHIDPISGDTYVTEYVPGITENEEETEERFNIRDYILQD
ncbi:MAG: hypothetical protein J5517_03960 [Eubacterium sp.]|nr:hypothetical protein [Eubacterium sp.]